MRDKQPMNRFVMTGFSQVGEARLFTFDRIEADNSRSKFTVQADLRLVRLYGIRVQELPLLCCDLLERSLGPDTPTNLTYGEDLMREHKAARTAAAEQRYRAPKRVPAGSAVSSWRTDNRRP